MKLVLVVLLVSCSARDAATPVPRPVLRQPPAVTHAPTCGQLAPWPAGVRICAQAADCTGPHESCFPDGPPRRESLCGAYEAPTHDCERDADCSSGEVCGETGPGPCDGVNKACVARCRCSADERCRSDGHCEPKPCRAGYVCAVGMRCGGDGADEHGCAEVPCWEGNACDLNLRCTPGTGCTALHCTTAADCDCGACVEGVCHARPGVCADNREPEPPA